MSTIVEFVINMKSAMGGQLQGIAATAQRAFNTVNTSISGTNRNINTASNSINGLKAAIERLTNHRNTLTVTADVRDANRQIAALERRLQSMTGSGTSGGGMGGFRNMAGAMALGGLVAGGIGTLASAAIQQGREVISAGMQGGATKSEFQTMAGDAKGGALYNNLTKYIQDSVFGNSLYKDAGTLMGFGEAVQNVMPDLKMLGDVSKGNAEKMSSLALVYGQTLSAGKLTGGDLLQYINTGFNPLMEIARTSGKSYAGLREQMEKGEITFNMVKGAFQSATGAGGRFYGMLDKIGKTPFGKWEAMKGNIESAKLQLGTALQPLISGLLDASKRGIDRLPELMDTVYRKFSIVWPAVEKFGGTVMDIVKTLMAANWSDTMMRLLKSLINLGDVVLNQLKPAFEAVSTATKLLADTLGPLVNLIGDVLNSYAFKGIKGFIANNLTPAGNISEALKQYSDYKASKETVGQNVGKAYFWDKNSMPGMMMDDARAQIIEDAVKANAKAKGYPEPHFFKTVEEITKWNAAHTDKKDWFTGDIIFLKTPLIKDPAAAGGKDALTMAAGDASGSVIGGGRKSITINFTKEAIKQEFQVGTMAEAISVGMAAQQEFFLRMLQGAAAAL